MDDFARARRVLLNAADLIARNGWCKYDARRGRRRCAVGAVWEFTGVDDSSESLLIRAIAFESIRLVIGTEGISGWNDSQPSAAPVIAALRLAAEALDV